MKKLNDEINLFVNLCLSQLHEGMPTDELFARSQQSLALLAPLSSKKDDSLNYQAQKTIEKYGLLALLVQFFQTGTVLAQADLSASIAPLRIGDEEYLSALFSFCQELENYCLKRATELDSASVQLCLELVDALFEKFLEFDFRNGPLRRKYDGVKYILKTLQNICYDLSIASYRANKPPTREKPETTETVEPMAVEGGEPTPEQRGAAHHRFSRTGLDELKGRLDEYDQKREEVIKQCRDAQKASKQAIYSVHRKEQKKSEQQIAKAAQVLTALLPIIEQEPSLRFGSYSNACEEYAEAVLFCAWMFRPGRPLLSRSDEALKLISDEEYLGGLVDFTGEVGRYAVVMATGRQKAVVQDCSFVSTLIRQHVEFAKGLRMKGDKLVALRTNCKKLQTLLYELTIAEYAGKASSVVVETLKDEKENNEEL